MEVNLDTSTSTYSATTTPIPNPTTSGSPTKKYITNKKGNMGSLYNVILDFDQEEKDLLKNGGIRKMRYVYRYGTDPEDFNRRFVDNLLTVVTICFFYMHFYVNDYRENPSQLFSQK